MQEKKSFVMALAGLVAIAIACGGHPTSPTSSPSPVALTGPSSIDSAAGGTAAGPSGGASLDGVPEAAADDDVTLKASAPTPTSPVNDERLPAVATAADIVNIKPTLVTGAARPTYAQSGNFQYRFQVFNPAGAVIEEVVQSGTSYTMTRTLIFSTRYTWRVRAEQDGATGPWSTNGSFVTPAEPIPPPPPPPPPATAFIGQSEVRDPLTIGRTVGVIHGNVRFAANGAQMMDRQSYIHYELPVTLTEGEFSLEVTNMPANIAGGDKQKVMAMGQGYDDIVTNDRRMTVEKRGVDGVIAWRFITRDDQVDTEGSDQRIPYPFNRNLVYFWEATWRNNVFRVRIKEGGVNGRVVYDFPKTFVGQAYNPRPHVIYVGSPIGRSGEASATIEQVIYKILYVGAAPRPIFP